MTVQPDPQQGQSQEAQRRPLGPEVRVVVVDDEPHILRMVQRLLRGTRVEVFQDAQLALEHIQAEPPDTVLCDVMMPELSGQQVYEQAVAVHPRLAGSFVFMSGGVLIGELKRLLEGTGCPLLEKPFAHALLVESLERAAARRQTA